RGEDQVRPWRAVSINLVRGKKSLEVVAADLQRRGLEILETFPRKRVLDLVELDDSSRVSVLSARLARVGLDSHFARRHLRDARTQKEQEAPRDDLHAHTVLQHRRGFTRGVVYGASAPVSSAPSAPSACSVVERRSLGRLLLEPHVV